MRRTRKRQIRNPEETAARLLDAAEAAFNAQGFDGTDSNRIAREAGYAPQTFYRHFQDKTDVFLAVYQRWWQSESDAAGKILRAKTPVDAEKLADTLIAFHVKWRGFRRSLRHLAVIDDRVRDARAKARKAQIANARAWLSKRNDAEIYAVLLVLERLCDAIADGEFGDLGFPKTAARNAVIAAVRDALA
ncbi:MAG TPA: TetR/AcrR family transcriptional regulator [Rhizomicrobium sp.]|nr:TetR/AcrR family transcriptional regulator [Rhizomicrobium sp.]